MAEEKKGISLGDIGTTTPAIAAAAEAVFAALRDSNMRERGDSAPLDAQFVSKVVGEILERARSLPEGIDSHNQEVAARHEREAERQRLQTVPEEDQVIERSFPGLLKGPARDARERSQRIAMAREIEADRGKIVRVGRLHEDYETPEERDALEAQFRKHIKEKGWG